jgi:hypothetical protein
MGTKENIAHLRDLPGGRGLKKIERLEIVTIDGPAGAGKAQW